MTTAAATSALIMLETPIIRGETTIHEVTLRKPLGGDLRGLSIQSLMQCDYNACRTLVPRIAMPQILDTDFDTMPADDVAAFSGEILGFFMSQSQKAAIFAALGAEASSG